MKKVIHLNESELVQLIKKVISEQTDNPEILKSILDMGFDKKYCPNYKPESESLAFEYCQKNIPSLVISYRDGGLEIVDLKKKKIINSWEVFKTEDLLDLEGTVRSLMGNKIQEAAKFETKKDFINEGLITVRRMDRVERTVKTMVFFEYDIDDDILYLGNPKEQIGITYDGYFRDIDDEDIVYVPENMNAKELFREFAYQ
jgi:hypothetical protein